VQNLSARIVKLCRSHENVLSPGLPRGYDSNVSFALAKDLDAWRKPLRQITSLKTLCACLPQFYAFYVRNRAIAQEPEFSIEVLSIHRFFIRLPTIATIRLLRGLTHIKMYSLILLCGGNGKWRQ
jgi:hypothetical protein